MTAVNLYRLTLDYERDIFLFVGVYSPATAAPNANIGCLYLEAGTGNFYVKLAGGWTIIAVSGSSAPPSGAAGGDLSGTYPSPAVARVQGQPVDSGAPGTSTFLNWNGVKWLGKLLGLSDLPGQIATARKMLVSAGNGVTAGTPFYDVLGASDIPSIPASKLSATGTQDATHFLRGDNTWAVPAGGGGSSPTYDDDFGAVTLLAHFDGTNGQTTTVDSSLNARALTLTGGAALTTAQAKFGAASYDGTVGTSAGMATCADSADFDFGTGQFTVEAWVQFSSGTPGNVGIVTKLNSAFDWWLGMDDNTHVVFYYSTTGGDLNAVRGAWTPSGSTWYHVAVDRDKAGVIRVYVNGAVVASATYAGAIFRSASAVSIGNDARGIRKLAGYIDEVRITKGIARYAGAFTPPTTAYLDTTPPWIAILPASVRNAAVNAVLDNGTSALTTQEIEAHTNTPGTIIGWCVTFPRGVTGSVSIDVYKATRANAFANTWTKISATAPITVTAAAGNSSSTLTGWTTAIADGDVLLFVVTSATTATRAYVALEIQRS